MKENHKEKARLKSNLEQATLYGIVLKSHMRLE